MNWQGEEYFITPTTDAKKRWINHLSFGASGARRVKKTAIVCCL
jgi:hypothetical protein